MYIYIIIYLCFVHSFIHSFIYLFIIYLLSLSLLVCAKGCNLKQNATSFMRQFSIRKLSCCADQTMFLAESCDANESAVFFFVTVHCASDYPPCCAGPRLWWWMSWMPTSIVWTHRSSPWARTRTWRTWRMCAETKWSTWLFRALWHEEGKLHQLPLNHWRGLQHGDVFRLIPIEVNVRRDVLYVIWLMCAWVTYDRTIGWWGMNIPWNWCVSKWGLFRNGTSSGKIMTLTSSWNGVSAIGIEYLCRHTKISKIVWLPTHIPFRYPPLWLV